MSHRLWPILKRVPIINKKGSTVSIEMQIALCVNLAWFLSCYSPSDNDEVLQMQENCRVNFETWQPPELAHVKTWRYPSPDNNFNCNEYELRALSWQVVTIWMIQTTRDTSTKSNIMPLIHIIIKFYWSVSQKSRFRSF